MLIKGTVPTNDGLFDHSILSRMTTVQNEPGFIHCRMRLEEYAKVCLRKCTLLLPKYVAIFAVLRISGSRSISRMYGS
jgi:hypothetical protein